MKSTSFQRLRVPVFLAVCGTGLIASAPPPAYAQVSTQVSVSTTGTPGNKPSVGGVFSGDGRIVAFTSSADNLVTGDGNASDDVFVRDLAAHTTTRVSVATDGSERSGASGQTGAPVPSTYTLGPNISLNHDGSLVAFTSKAALDPLDTTSCGGQPCTDVYVRNRALNTTTLVSVGSDNAPGNGHSGDPDISGNGRYVLFTSLASNFDPGDQNGVEDVYLRDLTALTTTRISVPAPGVTVSAPSFGGRINGDGTVIAFISQGALDGTTDPVPCPRGSPPECGRAYVFDRTNSTMMRLPMPFWKNQADGADVTSVDITPDGRFIVFGITHPSVLVSADPGTGLIAVYDRQTTRVEAVGEQVGGARQVTINSSGRFVSGSSGHYRAAMFGPILLDRQLRKPEVSGSINISGPAYPISPDGLSLLFETLGTHAFDGHVGESDVFLINRDDDGDGIPSDYETQFGLNPNDPADAAIDSDGDGVLNLQEYLNGTDATGTFKRYFAEGAANSFFATRFGLFNPGDQTATVVLEFLGSNGQTRGTILTLPAHGWTGMTLDDTTSLQPDNDFSTVIESDQPVVVDRTMTWDKTGYGSHAETSIARPATTWYLAEGSTGGSFDLFYLLQNPGDAAANVTVNYLLPAPQAPIVKQYVVGPKSRRTIYVDLEGAALAGTDVSAKITADQPILAERSMYFSTPSQPFAAGHEGAAVEASATSWFFAEGATGSFFDLFLLLANAEATDANVQVTYLRPSGAPIIKTYTVKAQSRLTINVDVEDPLLLDTPVSSIVESTNGVPIIAERAMWWPSPNWYEAHLSAGATTPGTRWALADGLISTASTKETETYILIANTSGTAGTADVTIYPSDASAPITKTYDIAAHSRTNVPVSVEFPAVANLKGFGTIIQSSGPSIVVERAIYTNANGQTWAAGSDALGTKLQ
jgi:Tol biopolymer transport system component